MLQVLVAVSALAAVLGHGSNGFGFAVGAWVWQRWLDSGNSVLALAAVACKPIGSGSTTFEGGFGSWWW